MNDTSMGMEDNSTDILDCPIYEKGDTSNFANYRPISLLTSLYKLFAAILKKRLAAGLDHLLTEAQFGFRANHSTEVALLSLMDRTYKAIDSKEYILLLSIDLRKAFEEAEKNSPGMISNPF